VKREARLLLVAARDLEDAFWWYERQRKGLGDEFLLAFEATVESLQRLPESHEVVVLNTRKATLRRFPYVVLYALDDGRIIVTAVLHAHRDPRSWSDRVREKQPSHREVQSETCPERHPTLLAGAAEVRGSVLEGRGVGIEDRGV
jgi:plasmid stabilization system protein ParE